MIKSRLLASMMAGFLGISALAGASLQQANTEEGSPLTRDQALQIVWRVPNFRALVTALKNSGDELDFGKATFAPTAEGSERILVIKGDSNVVKVSFDATTLAELVLIAPPNVVVDVLKGAVHKFDLTRRSIDHREGRWKGTASLEEMTTIAPSTRNN